MDANEIELRFQRALRSAEPAKTLLALAKSLKSEGMLQREMYDVFDSRRALYRNEADEKLHDAIADVMDCIVGWCSPASRLYDTDMKT